MPRRFKRKLKLELQQALQFTSPLVLICACKAKQKVRLKNGSGLCRLGFCSRCWFSRSFPQVLLGLQTFVVRDFGFFVYPLAHFQRDCFWRGEIPFWNPYNYCGVPFLAQWNTMPLYPPSLIYLTLPLEWSLSFFCLLHLWFAGLGMYFLARKWTGNNFAAAFAGTVFSFNGFTLNLIMWPSHLATFAWMPWVVLAVELAWREGGRKIILAALAGAMQMLAGGPEIIFFTWILLLALWIQQFVKSESPRRKMLWRFPLVVALVIALTLIQLLPFLDLVAHSQRNTGYIDTRWSLPLSGWANFLVPTGLRRHLGHGRVLSNTGRNGLPHITSASARSGWRCCRCGKSANGAWRCSSQSHSSRSFLRLAKIPLSIPLCEKSSRNFASSHIRSNTWQS